MKTKVVMVTCWFLILFSLTAAAKANPDEPVKEKKSISKKNETLVNVQISFLGGELSVSGGASDLVNATFEYSQREWQPEINYSVENKIGNLKIWMPEAEKDINTNDDDINEWDIKLNNNTLMDLSIKLGGGEGTYDLSNLKMNSLEIRLLGGELDIDLHNSSLPKLNFKALAGEANVDLSGKWDNDLNADFVGGVGELNLKLPEKVGVRIHASGILGNIEAPGFIKENSNYTNDAYQKTKATLYIDIFGGIGNVNLELVE
ncbi:MAG TPA: toast rack family protein [bacterium]